MKGARFFCIIGPQGSGKGTQAELLSEKFKIPHVSTGDIYRSHMRKKTVLGVNARSYIDRGKLVPDIITNRLIGKTLKSVRYRRGVILDGYPRTVEQALYLDTIISHYRVIYFKIADKKVIERLGARRVCARGHIYNLYFKPPRKKGICDQDGLSLLQRDDDKPALIKKRLDLYHRLTKPLLTHYKKKKMLLEINASPPIAKVWQNVKKKLS